MIDIALNKVCGGTSCNARIPYADRYCNKCKQSVEVNRSDNNRYYDKTIRQSDDDIKYYNFYHSKVWRQTADEVKRIYKTVDIYEYFVNGVICVGYVCHHIEPIKIKAGWEHRLDIDKIIYLSDDNHKLVHSMMERDSEGTKKLLLSLIKRWENERPMG